jgi:hypothetical protein
MQVDYPYLFLYHDPYSVEQVHHFLRKLQQQEEQICHSFHCEPLLLLNFR